MTGPVGVILAGGTAARMGGGDKVLLPLGKDTVLGQVRDRFSPQVAALALNANGDPGRFAAYGLPVLPDAPGELAGPLAGVLAGLDWAAAQGASHLVTVPGDTPFLPCDLVPRLLLAAETEGRRIAVAASGGRRHPVAALWHVDLRPALAEALSEGRRRVGVFADAIGAASAAFEGVPSGPDPFFNINTPADHAVARTLALALA
ncbi:MAG: molybdenum cofactor guanylyltransferase MobA [Limimaricola sp.]|uniref:molybdenum cofactor guanylyltransferase MobA n=1 Tax=Limimaricola sp. TaxID=2211665 RepID=UPI001D7287BA|nr:molybdenum cofactor guanylyltransferase MobA [Limimaricola sp.]MBI1417384.1 molybdenum cofactor guanylyltransferase MobA [Limimaricola sp.]